MANTYTQIYVQVVFAVEGRQNLIARERKEELQKYMTGIVSRQGQKVIACSVILLALTCRPYGAGISFCLSLLQTWRSYGAERQAP